MAGRLETGCMTMWQWTQGLRTLAPWTIVQSCGVSWACPGGVGEGLGVALR